MTSSPPSYTTVHVAQRLGVSLQTVQRWVDAGYLRAWKTPGGHRRIEAASAEALFKSRAEGIGPTADAAAATAATAATEADASADTTTVVIVEDDAAARTLIEALVRSALPRARVAVARNGFQGLLVIGRLAPQIVITDVQMPHMNGLELLRHLTQDDANRPRLLIAVSALARDDLARAGTLPPGVQLFAKPLQQDRFQAALRAGA